MAKRKKMLTLPEFWAFLQKCGESLNKESERATPLVALEYLSGVLEHFLRLKFTSVGLSDDEQHALLSPPFGLLCHFGARVKLSRAFGFISADLAALLDDMRVIRNHCGHDIGVATLQDTEIADEVRRIREFCESGHERLNKMVAGRFHEVIPAVTPPEIGAATIPTNRLAISYGATLLGLWMSLDADSDAGVSSVLAQIAL
jgi:hypothetical protein